METNRKLWPFCVALLPLFVLVSVVVLDGCQRNQNYYTTISGVKIPKEVQRYLTALDRRNLAAQQAAFGPDATVTDPMGRFGSQPELRDWLAHFNSIFRRVEVLGCEPVQDGHTLLMRWTPQQEQHQWTAYYTFEYRAGRIARLRIHAENPFQGGTPAGQASGQAVP